MVDDSIVAAVRRYLHTLMENGFSIRFGVLFGSHALGKAGKWSDIDLLVVSPQFDGLRNRRDVERLWSIAALTDSRVEPIPCGETQWGEDDSSAIIEIARREGILINI